MKFSRIACALVLAAASAAQAAPVTFSFTGVLDSSDIDGYSAGSAVSGLFSYDTDTPSFDAPSDLGDGVSLVTYAIDAPDSLVLNIGSDVMTFSQLGIVIVDSANNDAGSGEFFALTASGQVLNGASGDGVASFTLATQGINANVLTTQLPSSLDLADFDAPMISRVGSFQTDLSGEAKAAVFTMTSLTKVSAVPEPSTAWTMLVGLGIVGVAMRRRTAGH